MSAPAATPAGLAGTVRPPLYRSLGGPILWIYAVVVLGLGGFTLWAASAPLFGGAMMPGRVAVDTNRQSVQHLEGGIIDEILVRDGSVVAAGDLLIRLHDVRAQANLQVLRDRLHASLAQRARLLAERDHAETIEFPDRLLAQATDPVVAEQIRSQQIAFTSRRDTREGQVSILLQRIEQLGRQRDGLVAQQKSIDLQLATVQKELAGVRRLFAEGLAAQTRLLALERTAADLAGRRGQVISEIARNDVAVGEARLQIDQVGNTFNSDVVQDLERVEREIAEIDEQISAAQDQADRTEIRAPVGGVVVGLTIHTRNGVVAPGARLMDIVPQNQPLVIEAFVSPTDVDKVIAGEEAEIRFTTFSARKTPSVFGSVSIVSADVLNDDKEQQAFYLARITVPEDEIARLGGVRLLPGMPVEVIVRTDERTALDYLVRPLIDMLTRSFKED
jgi:HlyD family type I secretion membrane fusion protein